MANVKIKKTKMKRSMEDKAFTWFVYILATFFLIIAMYPIWYVLIASFSDASDVAMGRVWLLPMNFTIEGYKMMLEYTEIWSGYANTIFYTFAGTLLSLVITVPAAYALSRKTLPFRKAINFYCILTMFISGGMIPMYLLVQNLGLLDTRTIIVLMGAVSIWNMTICRTFFETSIPLELIESAKLDGCDEFRIFARIVLPLSKAIIAVMVLYFAVARWNSYYTGLIYLRDEVKWPLQLVLRTLLNSMHVDAAEVGDVAEKLMSVQSMKYGIIVVASAPVLMMYPFVQKYFVKGIMIGSVKS